MLYLGKPHRLQQHDITTALAVSRAGPGPWQRSCCLGPCSGAEQGEQSCRTDTDTGRGAALGRSPGKARDQALSSASHGEENADQPLSISVSKSVNWAPATCGAGRSSAKASPELSGCKELQQWSHQWIPDPVKIQEVLMLITDFIHYFLYYKVSQWNPSLFLPGKKCLRDSTSWLTHDHYTKAPKQM